MPACDQGCSSCGEASWTELGLNRPGVGNGDGAFFMQFALPAIVKQAECRVAALLNLGEYDTGANGVDRAGGDEDDVAFCDGTPLREGGNRAGPDRCAQSLWREAPLQSQRNPRAWACCENVPGFSLAVRQAN